jgi:hypothetical protein
MLNLFSAPESVVLWSFRLLQLIELELLLPELLLPPLALGLRVYCVVSSAIQILDLLGYIHNVRLRKYSQAMDKRDIPILLI